MSISEPRPRKSEKCDKKVIVINKVDENVFSSPLLEMRLKLDAPHMETRSESSGSC